MLRNHPKIAQFQHSAQLKLAFTDLREFASHFELQEKRETEKQAALFTVRHMLRNRKLQIEYLPNGKPFVADGPKISISHAYDKLVVLFSLNGKEVGVDIEKIRDKILNIRHKFLSREEFERLGTASLAEYTLYWAVKEAVYKASGIEGLAFAEQIRIEPFHFIPTGGSLVANVITEEKKNRYVLHYSLVDDYVLTYTDNA